MISVIKDRRIFKSKQQIKNNNNKIKKRLSRIKLLSLFYATSYKLYFKISSTTTLKNFDKHTVRIQDFHPIFIHIGFIVGNCFTLDSIYVGVNYFKENTKLKIRLYIIS